MGLMFGDDDDEQENEEREEHEEHEEHGKDVEHEDHTELEDKQAHVDTYLLAPLAAFDLFLYPSMFDLTFHLFTSFSNLLLTSACSSHVSLSSGPVTLINRLVTERRPRQLSEQKKTSSRITCGTRLGSVSTFILQPSSLTFLLFPGAFNT